MGFFRKVKWRSRVPGVSTDCIGVTHGRDRSVGFDEFSLHSGGGGRMTVFAVLK